MYKLLGLEPTCMDHQFERPLRSCQRILGKSFKHHCTVPSNDLCALLHFGLTVLRNTLALYQLSRADLKLTPRSSNRYEMLPLFLKCLQQPSCSILTLKTCHMGISQKFLAFVSLGNCSYICIARETWDVSKSL